MSQTKKESEQYKAKYISNNIVEWLIEHGKKNQVVFFKGEVGDRFTIYVFNKRNKTTVDIYTVYNTWSHNTELGKYIATIKDYKLTIVGSRSNYSWKNEAGDVVKQLKRQGVSPRGYNDYKLRYCRSAYFMRTHDSNEFTPWIGMKIDLKAGLLINKPTKECKKDYLRAKATDKDQRRRNYIANRENLKALARYKKAGGDTEAARGGWNKETKKWRQPEVGAGVENINWDMIPVNDVFKHRNATLRSNIIEHYGMNAILATLKHKVVDEETIDGRHYKLLDVTIPDFSNNRSGADIYQGLYLEMINPSTGESHFEGVPNQSNSNWGPRLNEATVKAALAWRDNDISILSGENFSPRTVGSDKFYVKPIILT